MIEDWQWVRKDEALEIHEIQIARHGGSPGVRDEGLLGSALGRPVNMASYSGVDDPMVLAAAYGFGIARNHPFVDGNKRTAFVVTAFFLDLCGIAIDTTQDEVVKAILALADGSLEEDGFADWLRGVTAPNE